MAMVAASSLLKLFTISCSLQRTHRAFTRNRPTIIPDAESSKQVEKSLTTDRLGLSANSPLFAGSTSFSVLLIAWPLAMCQPGHPVIRDQEHQGDDQRS